MANGTIPKLIFEMSILIQQFGSEGRFFKITDTFRNYTILHESQGIINEKVNIVKADKLVPGMMVVSQALFYEGMMVANPIIAVEEVEPLDRWHRIQLIDGRTTVFQGLLLVAT